MAYTLSSDMFSLFRRKNQMRTIPLIKAEIERIDATQPSIEDLLIFCLFSSVAAFWDNMNCIYKLPPKFKNDGVCFEIATYLIFRVDFYSFTRDSAFSLRYLPLLQQHSDSTFRDTLGLSRDDFCEITNNRFEVLKRVAQNSDAPAGVMDALLLRYIYDTSNNNGIPRYGLDHHKQIPMNNQTDSMMRLLTLWHPIAIDAVQSAVDNSI